MARLEKDIETKASPEQVLAALTDFTDKRPEIWPSIAKEFYEVYSVGETEAHIREGNKPPPVWAKEHYDWSKPGVIRWTVEESNFCKPGGYVETRIQPGEGGGSRLHVTWERHASNTKGRILLPIILATRGAPIWSSIKKNLDRYAEASRGE